MKVLSCIIAIALLIPAVSFARPTTSPTRSVKKGEVYQGAVGRTRDDIERYQRSSKEDKQSAMSTMVKDKRIFLLSDKTSVKVLDRNKVVSKVRVLEGTHRNKTGWVVTASITAGSQKAIKTPRRTKQNTKEVQSVPDTQLKP